MFLYSGSKSDSISSAQSSLGGFISSTPVLNDIEGVFQNDDYRTQYRLIVFKMNYPTADLRFWVEQQVESDFLIECSFVLPVIEPVCRKPYFEQILLPTSAPLQSDFQLYDSELNSKFVEGFVTGGYIGLWLKKSRKTSQQNIFESQSCSDVEQKLLELSKPPVSVDNFLLKVLIV